MASKLSQTLVPSPLALFVLVLVSETDGSGLLVIYWGQNGNESSLVNICIAGKYDIINIAFRSTFRKGQQPRINLAGHCNPASHNGCKSVGGAIEVCQYLRVKVLISIGGGSGSYTLSSAEDVRNVADHLWNNYLWGQSNSRPFGSAVLDVVDFDIEARQSYYDALARRLSEHSRSSGKKVCLTAAPQCPFPDKYLHGALSPGQFDYVWVQFYNNNCHCSTNRTGFKSAWRQWNKIQVKKIFVGLPASPAAAKSGYVTPQVVVSEILPLVKRSVKYGGVMLWDRYNDPKSGYSSQIKSKL